MRKEMPWPLTAGALLALMLQLPRQLTVAATLHGNQGDGSRAKGMQARNPDSPVSMASMSANPLLPLSHLLEAAERPD
jgi:hypothetical protein